MARTILEKKDLLASLPNHVSLDQKEILDLLLREEYGYLPPAPDAVEATLVGKEDSKFCAGKAVLRKLELTCRASFGSFSFPVYYTRPTKVTEPMPALVHINFRPDVPDRYQPTEEIVDRGYAVLSFCYQDVTSDDGDFTNGLAGVVYPDGKRDAHQCGKIGLWAWAALRVLEYARTLPELDAARLSVVGHSRLGKTALLTGAMDGGVYCAFSNDSGCSGAALSREKNGETIAKICEKFSYWFCEHYKTYIDNEQDLPFDQHDLIAANYPHRVYVASAVEDLWADPDHEFLSCVAASDYYIARGQTGFVHNGLMPTVGDCFHAGNIGYHLRDGLHYLSRADWNCYFAYLEKQGEM